jgi:hypothetical protein
MTTDEGIRADSSVESLAKLRPAFREDGRVTAGNASQITDGSSAVLVMSEEKAAELGLTPRARFHAFALAGVDPVTMLTGPIPATAKVLAKAGMTLDDIDLIEINEAFASVVLAWQKEFDADLSKVNVNGVANWCTRTKLGGIVRTAPIMADKLAGGGTWDIAANTGNMSFGGTPPLNNHIGNSKAPSGGNFLFEDGHVQWRKFNPADPRGTIDVGAYRSGSYILYKIPNVGTNS